MIGTPISAGRANAPLLVLDEPLSFWGGTDVDTGRIIDRRHPQHGLCVAGRVLAMPSSRGSSSSSTVLAEMLRRGVGPSGILLRQPDAIVVLAAIVTKELYGIEIPVVVLPPVEFGALPRSGVAAIDTAGDIAEVRHAV